MSDEISPIRSTLFNTVMQVPHREIAPIVTQYHEIMAQDPDLMGRVAVYLIQGGTAIRDQQDAALVTLLQSPPEYPFRDAGRVLMIGTDATRAGGKFTTDPLGLRGFDDFRMFRIMHFVAGSNIKSPRLMRGLAQDWATWLERDYKRWEQVAIANRPGLTWMYVHYSLPRPEWVSDALVKSIYRKGSRLELLHQAAQAESMTDRSGLLIQARAPYKVAQSFMTKNVKKVSAQDRLISGLTLLELMSPTEALNSQAWLEKKGFLKMPEVAAVWKDKTAKSKVSLATLENRASISAGASEETKTVLAELKEKATERAREKANIVQPSAFFMDISGSLTAAAALLMELGAYIAPLSKAEMVVLAFNAEAREITVQGDRTKLATWKRALSTIKPNGGTSPRAALRLLFERMAATKMIPGSIVIVTDNRENTTGEFAEAFKAHKWEIVPRVVVVGVGDYYTAKQYALDTRGGRSATRDGCMTAGLDAAKIAYDEFVFGDKPDYNLFDNLAHLLGGERQPTAAEREAQATASLVERILKMKLPARVALPVSAGSPVPAKW